jgi:hypothetical protein
VKIRAGGFLDERKQNHLNTNYVFFLQKGNCTLTLFNLKFYIKLAMQLFSETRWGGF